VVVVNVDGDQAGEDLVAKQRHREVKAIDLTFSAPKSVSVLWALGSEDVHSVVMGAHRDAVAAALGFLEERALVARRQVGGVRSLVATDGLAVAGFVHRTSRAGDPQVHSHCLTVNLTRRVDGRVVALDARPLFVWARAAGSVYQAELQRALTTRLGVAWGPDRHGTREIDGFSRNELRVFSKRTVQIEAELAAVGAGQLTGGQRARADDAASLATRVAKDKGLTPARLVGPFIAVLISGGCAAGPDDGRGLTRRRVAATCPSARAVLAAGAAAGSVPTRRSMTSPPSGTGGARHRRVRDGQRLGRRR